MQTTRTPAVAGMFYPASAAELHSQVQTFLNQVPVPAEPPPKAIIAPHAGYIYSGPIAASAYARLSAVRTAPGREKAALITEAIVCPIWGGADIAGHISRWTSAQVVMNSR